MSPQDQVRCLLWSLRRVRGWKTTSEPRDEAERARGLSCGLGTALPDALCDTEANFPEGWTLEMAWKGGGRATGAVEAAGLGLHTPSSDQELTSGPHTALQETPDRPSHQGETEAQGG